MKALYFLLAISFLGVSGQILYNDEGFVPQACQVRWTNAGTLSGFPIVADAFFNVAESPYNADIADNGNDDYPAIEAIFFLQN